MGIHFSPTVTAQRRTFSMVACDSSDFVHTRCVLHRCAETMAVGKYKNIAIVCPSGGTSPIFVDFELFESSCRKRNTLLVLGLGLVLVLGLVLWFSYLGILSRYYYAHTISPC